MDWITVGAVAMIGVQIAVVLRVLGPKVGRRVGRLESENERLRGELEAHLKR